MSPCEMRILLNNALLVFRSIVTDCDSSKISALTIVRTGRARRSACSQRRKQCHAAQGSLAGEETAIDLGF